MATGEFHLRQRTEIRTAGLVAARDEEKGYIRNSALHMDIVPTLMPYLEVTNPGADYSLGHALTRFLDKKA